MLVQIIGFAGVGAFIDAMMPRARKQAIVDYIVGRKNSRREEFESATISGLIEILSKPACIERLSLKRVLLFSIVVNLLTTLAADLHADGRIDNPAIAYFVAFAVAPIMSFPLDLVSLRITKWLFFYRPLKNLAFFGAIAADALCSTLPLMMIVAALAALSDTAAFQHVFAMPLPGGYTFIFTAGLLLNGASGAFMGAVLLNLIQLVTWVGGVTLSGLNRVARGSLLAEPFEQVPFTVMFLFVALGLACADLAIG